MSNSMNHNNAGDSETVNIPTQQSGEARAAHSCPSWCMVTPSKHEAALPDFDGYRVHDSFTMWEKANGRGLAINVTCSTTPTGELDVEDPPMIVLDNVDELTADEARGMAATLLEAAAMIDALTDHRAVA